MSYSCAPCVCCLGSKIFFLCFSSSLTSSVLCVLFVLLSIRYFVHRSFFLTDVCVCVWRGDLLLSANFGSTHGQQVNDTFDIYIYLMRNIERYFGMFLFLGGMTFFFLLLLLARLACSRLYVTCRRARHK